ncbi:cyclic GMP-AMP synthase [Hoplias malabaricus]|uniref:cyclic GMP-AMP synthase n=1 Tax=Hoplias malabaricus TaxID=27720 RepID=UPI0034624E77
MPGRGRPRKTAAESPRDGPAADGTPEKGPGAKEPGSTKLRSCRKTEERSGGSAENESPAKERKKTLSKKKDTQAPVSSKPTCAGAQNQLASTTENSTEETRALRNPPKKSSSLEHSPNKLLRETLENLKIKKIHRSEATKCVNDIQEAVTRHVSKNLHWCKDIKVLRTGSHYENVKICDSDEFDVMMAVSVERVDIQPFGDDGAFYSVAMKRHQTHVLDKFLNDDKTIRASEMLQEFRESVKEVTNKLPYEVTVERKKPGCPAVTLKVMQDKVISLDFVLGLEVHSSSWPSFTVDGFKIDKWLGKTVKTEQKRKPYYLVSKYEGSGQRELDGVIAKDAWRISFSHVEKFILKNHGLSKTCCETRPTCCRKQCLKLLKYLVQRLKEKYPKEAAKLCSYHAKTTLLHSCASRVEDSEWATDQLSHCFQQLLHDFEEHLRRYQLPNFFIPSHNLLKSAGLDNKTCILLANHIEFQRNNNFPLFDE